MSINVKFTTTFGPCAKGPKSIKARTPGLILRLGAVGYGRMPVKFRYLR
jgi:hypothetical protein